MDTMRSPSACPRGGCDGGGSPPAPGGPPACREQGCGVGGRAGEGARAAGTARESVAGRRAGKAGWVGAGTGQSGLAWPGLPRGEGRRGLERRPGRRGRGAGRGGGRDGPPRVAARCAGRTPRVSGAGGRGGSWAGLRLCFVRRPKAAGGGGAETTPRVSARPPGRRRAEPPAYRCSHQRGGPCRGGGPGERAWARWRCVVAWR